MGHMHLYVKDVAAQTHFWVDIMGGTPVHNEKLSLIAFPGVFLILTQADPTDPPAGIHRRSLRLRRPRHARVDR